MSYDRFSSIDWVEDYERENAVKLQRMHDYEGKGLVLAIQRLYHACQSWLALAVAGSIIGVIAAGIDIVVSLLADVRSGYCSAGWYLDRASCCMGFSEESCETWVSWSSYSVSSWVVYIFFSFVYAMSAVTLVLCYSPQAAGSGISEIKCIVAGFIMKGFLGLRTLVIKSLALPLTVASGFSVGKEGPSVHYASCVGNVIGRTFAHYRKHNAKRREMIVACAGAGVAVAFGSPIGGTLFALEEMTSTWTLTTVWRSYFCCLVATGVLTMCNPFRNGQMVLFKVQYDRNWQWFELPAFIILGAFGGIMGHFIIKFNLNAQTFRKRYLSSYPVTEVAALVLLSSAICYFNPYLRVDMTESMQILFHECEHGWEHESCELNKANDTIFKLLFALIIRTVLTIFSYGSKVPAGIFVPSLAIGSIFGRMLGTIAWKFVSDYPGLFFLRGCAVGRNCVDPGTYAFLGAGALLSGVMHINITVVIVMLELTGALTYVIPSMIVVGVATMISSSLDDGGIADKAIIANGYPFFAEDMEFEGTASEVMTKPEAVVEYGSAPSPLSHPIYPIIDEDSYLLGSITRKELETVPSGSVIDTSKNEVDRGPIIVGPNTRLSTVHEIFTDLGPRVVFVTDKGKLVGLLTRKDLLRSYKAVHPDVVANVTERPPDLGSFLGTVKSMLIAVFQR